MPIRVCLSGNEPRQRYLFEQLGHAAKVQAIVPFDDIDPLTKVVAAGLSFAWPRSEWWENYHMHPLIQRRRSRVLMRGLAPHLKDTDALFMWGSWFQPSFKNGSIPCFHYIDQSRSLENLPGEHKGRFSRRQRSHALQGRTYDAAAAVFCMSEWARQQTLEAHRVAPEKVIAVGWGPCAVDLSHEAPASTAREPIVLHISNDFYRKGIDYLIATAARVRKTIPAARFIVVGRDASGFDVPGTSDVEFMGPIYDKPKLEELFRKASVFFLPHRFDRSPHVLVEAMSAGLPLVASAQGGAVEIIQRKDTGYLCASGSIDDYVDALVSLLSNADQAQRMGANGLALMRQYYNWPSIARRMIGHMERIVSGPLRRESQVA